MGKRKRKADENKTPPPSPPLTDAMLYTSRTDSLSNEKSSHSVDSSTLKSLSSIMDMMDSSGKLPNTHHSHQNLSCTILSRHYYGRQYFRRNSTNNADASTSRGKENKKKAFCRPERIRSRSLAVDAVSSDAVKMVCGICEKLLKRKPYILGNTLSAGDLSVVAVLVCGHVYHAECLEQRTCREDRWDPPCPLCMDLLSQLDASRGQE